MHYILKRSDWAAPRNRRPRQPPRVYLQGDPNTNKIPKIRALERAPIALTVQFRSKLNFHGSQFISNNRCQCHKGAPRLGCQSENSRFRLGPPIALERPCMHSDDRYSRRLKFRVDLWTPYMTLEIFDHRLKHDNDII